MCNWCCLVYLIPVLWLVTLNKSLFQLFISHLASLTRYWFASYCHQFCFLFMACWLTLNRSLFWFSYIWHCLLTRYWFVQCQQHLYIKLIWQCNFGSMAADFEQVTVSTRLSFPWLLYIYIILDKGCHILYVFDLNSTVCSQRVGVHLYSGQISYGFMMDADLYQFVIFNPWKVSWNWIAFYQNSFVLSSGLLYHLIRRDTGRLANETFTSNPIVSLKEYLTV